MNNSETNYKKKLMKTVDTFLKRWNGNNAKILDYRSAHSSLTIRITSKGKQGNLHISCLGPEYIQGPFTWENCNFVVTQDIVLNDGNVGYLIVDNSVGFEVKTEGIDIAENCKPTGR